MENPARSDDSSAVPRIFISYAWTNPTHQQWVVRLATALRQDGIDVILDVWDLKPGQDKFRFMEQMVTDPGMLKVLVICNAVYALKADGREGGVGDETQIITPEVYTHASNEKFIPVLSEIGGDGNRPIPAYLKSRIYIDLSNEQVYYDGYESLLRLIHGAPALAKPAIGRKPGFLDENAIGGSRTSPLLRRAIHALLEEKRTAHALTKDHLNAVRDVLIESQVGLDATEPFDEHVLEGVQQTKIYRDEVLELLHTLCEIATPENIEKILFHFFDGLLVACHPQGDGPWKDTQFDPARFATMELFLYTIATLLNHDQFAVLSTLLGETFVYREKNNRSRMENFNAFWFYIESLERFRKQRLRSDRVSITADLLKDRADHKNISFAQLQQVDFLLFLRSCFTRRSGNPWYPKTLVYLSHYPEQFEIFRALDSKRRMARLKAVLDVESAADLRQRFETTFPDNQSRLLNLGGNWAIPLEPLLDLTSLGE